MIKDKIRNIIPKKIKDFINYRPSVPFVKESYSQEGEDLMLDIMLAYKKRGIYVDIGAHHPFKFSNTYYFYLKGWSGVCIDPRLGVDKLFEKHRPRDVFLNKGVGLSKKKLVYYKMKDPALNTFVKEIMEKRVLNGFELEKVLTVEVMDLESILNKYLKTQTIDFMSIDVEGFEKEVLLSNNWIKYKPSFVIVHLKSNSIEDCLVSDITKILLSRNYILYAKSYHSIFFKIKSIN